MANETMTLISTVTVGSGGASSIEFTAIPATYTDLYLVVSARSQYSGWADAYLRFNASGGTAYATKKLAGTGSSIENLNSTGAGDFPIWSVGGSNTTSNTFSNVGFYIPNYAGSTNKSVSADGVSENNGTEARLTIGSGLWASTNAITQILLFVAVGWTQYSTASLYGITKGSGGATVS